MVALTEVTFQCDSAPSGSAFLSSPISTSFLPVRPPFEPKPQVWALLQRNVRLSGGLARPEDAQHLAERVTRRVHLFCPTSSTTQAAPLRETSHPRIATRDRRPQAPRPRLRAHKAHGATRPKVPLSRTSCARPCFRFDRLPSPELSSPLSSPAAAPVLSDPAEARALSDEPPGVRQHAPSRVVCDRATSSVEGEPPDERSDPGARRLFRSPVRTSARVTHESGEAH